MARSAWQISIAALLALAGCGSGDEAAPGKMAQAGGERLVMRASDIADMKAVGATITTRDQAEARVRIPGTLVSFLVREGDMVAKGQRIGTVVDARLGYETSAYGARAAAAEAEAARAEADLARVQDLYRNGVYAKARLDQAVAASRAANAQLAAARAQQSASASVVGQGAILAPASGRVLRADVPAGSVVAPGMSIATITAGPPVLRLELPESVADRIRVGGTVLVTDAASSLSGQSGRVVQVYPAISGGRVTADATLPGLSAKLVGRRLGVSVEVGRRAALVVPRGFVSTRYGVDYVDVVAKDGTLSSVPVQTAPVADPKMIELLSGIAAGDTLYRAGKGA